MNIVDILRKIEARNAQISLHKGDLLVSGDDDVLTDELRTEIQQHKAALVQLLRRREEARVSKAPLVRRPQSGPAPLSAAQERIWFVEQMGLIGQAYNVFRATRFSGNLQSEAFGLAIAELVRRHDALRTRFGVENGVPHQVAYVPSGPALEVVDLSSLGANSCERHLQDHLAREKLRAFDLATGPLYHFKLVRLSASEHVFMFVLHHIVVDGWSLNILMRELRTIYDAHVHGKQHALEEPQLQYTDYVHWQHEWMRSGIAEQRLAYWRERLSGSALALDLPTDRPRGKVATHVGSAIAFAFPPKLSNSILALTRRSGTTLYMAVLAGIQATLARWSGQDDIVVGSPISLRTDDRMEAVVGLFLNMIVMRTDLSGNPSFDELLGRVRKVATEAYANQEVPLEQLVTEFQPGRHLARQPLFQVNLTMQNHSQGEIELTGLASSPVHTEHHSSQFDLSFVMRRSDSGIHGVVEYASDLFDPKTVERLIARLIGLLEAAAEDPSLRLSELPFLDEEERCQLVFACNDTLAPYPNDSCVHELISAVAAEAPNSPAIVHGDEVVSYAELERRANQLAHHLRARGVGAETVVGVCMGRTPQMIMALLAILKAGGCYVSLDPAYPEERLALMLSLSKASALIIDASGEERLSSFDGRFISIEADHDIIALRSEAAPAVTSVADGLAYVMYTSGSSGTPKGVGVAHSAIVSLIRGSDYCQIGSADTIVQASNISFDAATFEIWGALCNGARLAMIETEDLLSPEAVARFIEKFSVTIMFATTALFNQYARDFPDLFRSLKCALFGGEGANPVAVRLALENGRPGRLLHVYGPTEATTFASWWHVTEAAEESTAVPIGRPMSNVQLYVLDGNLEPLSHGAVGELYIGGARIARGYVDQPRLTAERFVPNPFMGQGSRLYRTGDLVRVRPSGEMEYVSRADSQVKVRGFRVEPGEIEAALLSHHLVTHSYVIRQEDELGEGQLVCYFIAAEISLDELRKHAANKLPSYMIPAHFVRMDAFPLTPNGKVDRKQMPSPYGNLRREGADIAAVTPAEEALLRIWCEVLGRQDVGLGESFFDLGGDSIRAIRLVGQARENGLIFSVRQLFERPSITALAAVVTVQGDGFSTPTGRFSLLSEHDRGIADQQDFEDAYPVSKLQEGMIFHNSWSEASAAYHDVLCYLADAELNAQVLGEAVQAMVDRHQVLRTTFDLTEFDVAVQCVHRRWTVAIVVEDWSELDETVWRQRIHRFVEQEKRENFDLAQIPPLRFFAFRLRSSRFVFVVSVHHAIVDGWSVSVMMTELCAHYFSRVTGDPMPRPSALRSFYRDYIALEQRALADPVQRDYWMKAAEGIDRSFLRLLESGDGSADAADDGDGKIEEEIPQTLCRKVVEFARNANVPVKTVFLAAHLNAVRLASGGVEAATGLVTHSRPESVDGEKMLGLFLNTVPVRVAASGISWFQFVVDIHRIEQDFLRARYYPVVDIYREKGGMILIGNIFNFTNFHVYRDVPEERRFRPLFGADQIGLPLVASVAFDAESASGKVTLAYQTKRFDADAMGTFLGLFWASLKDMLESGRESYLSAEERLRDAWPVLVEANIEVRTTVRVADSHEMSTSYTEPALDEKFWRERLLRLQQIQLPYEVPSERVEQRTPHWMVSAWHDPLQGDGLRDSRDVVLGAFAVYLARLTGRNRLQVGWRVARLQAQSQISPSMASIVPMECEIAWELPFSNTLQQIAEEGERINQNGTFRRDLIDRDADLRKVVELKESRPWRVAVSIVDDPSSRDTVGDLLTLQIDPLGRYRWLYDACRLDAVSVGRMAEHLWELVLAAKAGGDCPVSHLNILPAAERTLLLEGWNETEAAYPTDRCIHELFEDQAARSPEAIALVYEGQELSYAELNAQANRLAHHLIALGVEPDGRVAICVERSPAMVIGLLAILKAGGAYVPLDPDYQGERLAHILSDADPALVLADGAGREALGVALASRIVMDPNDDFDQPADNPVVPKLGQHHLAYVIYTSGSTGTPKGVMVEHSQVVRLFETAQPAYGFAASDVWCVFHSFAFDFSVWELWGALRYGGRLVLVPRATARDPHALYRLICEQGVTVLNQTPSAFKALVSQVRPSLDRLRYVIFGGEALEPVSLQDWYKEHGETSPQLVNMYGITETTVHVTHYALGEVDAGRRHIPIGRRLPDLCVYLLDERGEPVPLGAVGELYIGGAGVARGYLNRPDLTAERFLPNRFVQDPQARMYRTGDLARYLPDGNLVFLGRNDHQVKIRGFRIEPAEIEARLIEHPDVREAVVIAFGEEDKRLVAYVVGDAADPTLLRDFLVSRLPEYMVPSAFVGIDAIPLTANGKLDRQALPAVPNDQGLSCQYVPPGTPTENTLARIWAEVLRVDRVGLTDNFFELGGDSLLATKVVARVRKMLNFNVSTRLLFKAKSLREFAEEVQQGQKA
ncbi:non-ribosomal peptide synthetase [Xanthomonas arboricola]|uniref:non-ribosomal peptide synthetase n=1 Tax=Xanthomonas arboricola TaxID=56448 RepID=UPI000CEDBD8C|nr:non-ribosomal peptide synthetase [Xanthomonas arboricola]PPT24484.1 hypothetical protein XarbCFBP7614_21265 [Xanthomonas arboricola]